MFSSQNKSKKLVFFNKILEDGVGDLGHLIDIASPAILKKFLAPKDRLGNDAIYHSIYVIVCANPTPDRIRLVIQTLKENAMIIDQDNPYDFTQDKQIEGYVKYILEKNPHLILVGETYLNDQAKNNIPDIRTLTKMHIHDVSAAFMISHVEEASITDIMPALVYPALVTKISEHGKRINAAHRSRFEHAYTLGFFPKNCGVLLKVGSPLSLEEKANLLLNMQDRKFLASLLSCKNLTDISTESARNFLAKNLFVPGYLQKETAAAVFIQSIAGSALSKEFTNVIFHINANVLPLNLLDKNSLAQHGFANIILNTKNGQQKFTLDNATGNRDLIILTDRLEATSDYNDLYKIAQLFGGCSGDKSLELVLSNHLIPFYHEPRPGKFAVESLSNLTKIYISDSANIIEYIQYFVKLRTISSTDINSTSDNIIKLMDNDFVTNWKQLISAIQKNHNFYNKLQHVLETPIRTRDFYAQHAKSILDAIQQNDYRKALLYFNEFDPASPDLRCIMRWCLMNSTQKIIAAFIWAAFIRDEPKKDYLDRTQEEIAFDKKTGSRAEDVDRDLAEKLDKLVIKNGLDQVNFKLLMNEVALLKVPGSRFESLASSIFHWDQSKDSTTDASNLEPNKRPDLGRPGSY